MPEGDKGLGQRPLIRCLANITKYRACLDRRQLIPIAQKDQTSLLRCGIEQTRHQRQVDHGCFIKNQKIAGQWSRGIISGTLAGSYAQQPMNGHRLGHPLQGFGQHLYRTRKHLAHSGSGLTGRGTEQDPFGTYRSELLHQGQNTYDGCRFARAGPTADHQQMLIDRLGGGGTLIGRTRIIRKECVQPFGKGERINRVTHPPGMPANSLRQPALERIVAIQIEPPIVRQHQWGQAPAITHQRTTPERLLPD